MTTSTLTVTEFVLARIAEDEAAAKAAESGRWKLWGMSVMADPQGTSNVDDAIDVASTRTTSTAGGYLRTFNARHIARHDPARVLAQCAAMRKAVDAAWDDHLQIESEWGSCRGQEQLEAVGDEPDVVRALASIWSDHPQFDPAWA
jgi:hypothetical protein